MRSLEKMETKSAERKEEKIEDVLRRTFHFTILFSPEDKDLFDKFTRAEDIRQLGFLTRQIYERIQPGFDKLLTIDHINRNCFDNRRENLRLATNSEQMANRRKLRNNKSGHVGVSKLIEKKKQKHKISNYVYWVAVRSTKDSGRKSKKFPFTDQGLLNACKYYRQVLLADGSCCDHCHPQKHGEQNSAKDAKINDSSTLTKTLSYELICSLEEKDLFEKWNRADDARHGNGVAQKICERMSAKPTADHTVDHINQNCFDNRRENLRWATSSEQAYNKRLPRNHRSGHRGVSYYSKGRRRNWKAKAKVNGTEVSRYFPFTNIGLHAACAQYREWRGDGSVCETCESTYTISAIGDIIEETEDYITFSIPSHPSPSSCA